MMLELSGLRPKCGRPVRFAHGLCSIRGGAAAYGPDQRGRGVVALSL